MMGRLGWVAVMLGLLGLAAVVPGSASPPVSPPTGSRTAVAKALPEEIPARIAYRGVSTCASVACHGAPLPGNAMDLWQSAYSKWATHDPHARAYQVLWDDRSVQIVRQLDGPKATDLPTPWNDARCLACHSLPGAAQQPVAVTQDGVSCEACHGSAERWLVAHTAGSWEGKKAEYKSQFGMTNLDDLQVRIETCAGCHVGEGSVAKIPREVNHDLIAAGHPRLAFEFATYHANLPAHWQKMGDAAENEALNWALGQLVSAKANDRLRESHAKDFIEFSQKDCYACHHDLNGSTWPSAMPGLQSLDQPSSASLHANTWYHAMRPVLGLVVNDDTKLVPDADAVAAWAARQNADRLGDAIHTIAKVGRNAHHWDQAAQIYHALVAMNRSRGGPQQSAIDQELRGVFEVLRFSPAEDQAAVLRDSPANYQPAKYADQLESIVKILEVREP